MLHAAAQKCGIKAIFYYHAVDLSWEIGPFPVLLNQIQPVQSKHEWNKALKNQLTKFSFLFTYSKGHSVFRRTWSIDDLVIRAWRRNRDAMRTEIRISGLSVHVERLTWCITWSPLFWLVWSCHFLWPRSSRIFLHNIWNYSTKAVNPHTTRSVSGAARIIS